MICKNLSVSEDNHLLFAGQDTVALAKQYGTPLYLMDEERIRENCRTYLTAVKETFGERGKVLFASKAASFKRIYEIMKEEGMCTDVVSSGEIYTANKAGFPLENAYFHSNNKTDEDIQFAMQLGVGYFVVDSADELQAINRLAKAEKKTQNVLLRLTPGIDPHTFAAVSTGKVDSKFGSAIETGQAEEITKLALSLDGICLRGFHCHVGSQVFDSEVFYKAVDVMLEFIADMKQKYRYEAEELDLGGGYGVRYVESDPTIDIAANIHMVGDCIHKKAQELGITAPVVCFEPGRSIVADAGMTLYTVGSVKRIPGYKNYVSIDGGMTDNIRFALYGSSYTVLVANRVKFSGDWKASVVGRCCESGDIIQENVPLPEDIGRGETIAVLTTGAYNYAMASNYNKLPKPPIVMLNKGESYVAVRRESLEDLAHLDV